MSAELNILDLVERGGALARPHKFFVVLTFPVDRAAIELCLARPSVAGVVLPEEKPQGAFDDPSRIGRYYEQSSRWKFPNAQAGAIVVLGSRDSVGLGIVSPAYWLGVKRFVFVDPASGEVFVRSTFGLIGRNLAASLRQQFAHFTAYLPPITAYLLRKSRGLRRLAIHLAPRLPVVGPHIFALHLRGLLRVPTVLGIEASPSSNVVILAIGSLSPGGSERQVVNTALMLKRIGGFCPLVVCMRPNEASAVHYRSILDRAGVEVIELPKIRPLEGANAAGRRLLALCEKKCQRLGYDFTADVLGFVTVFLIRKPRVVHGFLDEINIKASIAAILTQVPKIVMSARSMAPINFMLHQNYMRPAYRVLTRHRELVFCNNSQAGAADYQRWLKVRNLKMRVVRNGIDFELFPSRSSIDHTMRANLGIPADVMVLGSVMRLSEEKQPTLWARVVIEISLRRVDVDFVLVGDGPLRDAVERLITSAGIENRVHLIPGTGDVAGVLRALDVFLLTSRLEGLPNVLIEAQAVGVPVVTTPAGGAAETLHPGVSGLIAPDQSVLGVANACLTLLDDHSLRSRMSTAAAEFVRDRFSLDRMIEETLRVYKVSNEPAAPCVALRDTS